MKKIKARKLTNLCFLEAANAGDWMQIILSELKSVADSLFPGPFLIFYCQLENLNLVFLKRRVSSQTETQMRSISNFQEAIERKNS